MNKEEYYLLNDKYYFTENELKKYFLLPYAITCNSSQGITLKDKYTITDLLHPFFTINSLYVSITRTDDIHKITFCFNPNNFIPKYQYKVQSYIEQDNKRGFTNLEMNKYITPEWIQYKIKQTNYRCMECFTNLSEDYTIDRNNNDKPHYKDNCRILCHHCCDDKCF